MSRLLIPVICCFALICAVVVDNSYASDKEALQVIKKHVEPNWLIEGDDWYTHSLYEDYQSTGHMKSVEIIIESNKLSEADKLNGLQWKGVVVFIAKAERRYNPNEKTWSQWTSSGFPFLRYIMTKINRAWNIQPSEFLTIGNYTNSTLNKPTMDDILSISQGKKPNSQGKKPKIFATWQLCPLKSGSCVPVTGAIVVGGNAHFVIVGSGFRQVYNWNSSTGKGVWNYAGDSTTAELNLAWHGDVLEGKAQNMSRRSEWSDIRIELAK